MRTTVEIPDETYRQVKILAAEQNTTVKEILLGALTGILQTKAARPPRPTLPMIHSGDPGSLDIDNEKIYDLIGFP